LQFVLITHQQSDMATVTAMTGRATVAQRLSGVSNDWRLPAGDGRLHLDTLWCLYMSALLLDSCLPSNQKACHQQA
jgi:hypothetical protein